MNIEFPEMFIDEYPIQQVRFGFDKIDNLYTCEVSLNVDIPKYKFEGLTSIEQKPSEFQTGTNPMMAFEKCLLHLIERVKDERST